MEKKILKNIFDNLENALYNEMAIRIEHNLEDGKYREYLVKRVLSKIIPSKYEITNGFIIDSNNNRSDEMDVIIYDKSYVPPFFDETYTIVPIEAVIAIVQVKTTLTNSSLKESIENLNSIDKLIPKTGGKVISANNCSLIEEGRYIAPYKILIAYKSKKPKKYDYCEEMRDIDMIYVVDNGAKLVIKHRSEPDGVVSLDKNKLEEAQSNYDIEIYKESRLCAFALNLLEKMKLINNALIINYEEYIKGAK